MSRLLAVAALALFTQMGIAQTPLHKTEALSDADLDRVTAGGIQGTATASGNTMSFSATVPTPFGVVSAVGNGSVLNQPGSGASAGSINLSGNALQGSSSLITTTAANSNVLVNLNLIVNINSTVGSIGQTNLGNIGNALGLSGLINTANLAGKH
jgi:hypothetical protein